MADPKQLKILKKGAGAWNQWRKRNPGSRPELHMANLQGANLSGADFGRADLSRANLGGANLSGANLGWVDLSGADLGSADLSGANFREAWLGGVTFSSANLSSADFTNSRMGATTLVNVDLSQVIGLETVKHTRASHIGTDTILHSRGKIPEVFLRGAGLPEVFITYVKSLVSAMAPIEFDSCFISYSIADQEFAERLHADLQAKKVRCWFAPHDVKAGEKLHEQIDAAICVHDRLLLVLSPASIHSDWVRAEIFRARKRELKEGRNMLFPIRLGISLNQLQEWKCVDAETGQDSAHEIRDYFIPDFSQWKDQDVYRQSLQRLLDGLQGKRPRGTAGSPG